MIRGTTPTLTFQLPFDVAQITKLNIAFAQGNSIVIEKSLSNVTRSGRAVSVRLTEADTLALDHKKDVEIQLRVAVGGAKMASNIIKTTVGRILKDGVL